MHLSKENQIIFLIYFITYKRMLLFIRKDGLTWKNLNNIL